MKRPARNQPLKTTLSPILGLVFKKALEFLNFFYYATGVFGSVILKILFLKMGFSLLSAIIS
ncbi:hypothetical protein HpCHN30_10080 [Helicobacter pylori]